MRECISITLGLIPSGPILFITEGICCMCFLPLDGEGVRKHLETVSKALVANDALRAGLLRWSGEVTD